MERVMRLFVSSLTGCLLVASFLSSCTGVHGPISTPSAGGPRPDTSGAKPPPSSRVQVGIASWYGRGFHGRLTASGEVYDMYQVTAAHRTVDLGTYALVTNLENGQAVRVRINDRGPFKRNRILDLSYEAARHIDLVRTGSARVKVEFQDDSLPSVTPAVMPISVAYQEGRSLPVSQMLVVQPLVVQAGAYRDQDNAVQVHKTLTAVHPRVWIAMAPELSQTLYRVRLGPFQNRAEAERVVHEVQARGYAAVIISMAQ
jgi:rare lipoprotein A